MLEKFALELFLCFFIGTMWRLFPTELIHPAWCLPLILFGLFFTAWWRKKRNVNQDSQILSISLMPYLYNFILYFIKYYMDSTHNLHPAEYFLQFVSGISYLHNKYKMVKLGATNHNYILCFESSVCESILKSSVALDKSSLYNIMQIWVGKDNIFTSETEKWKQRFKMLNPAFHSRVIKDFLPIFNNQSMMMIEKLKKSCGQEIEINGDLKLCSVNVIGETIMGVHMKTQENEAIKYFQAASNSMKIFSKWIMMPWLWLYPTIPWSFDSNVKATQIELKKIHSFSKLILLNRKATVLAEMKNSEVTKNYKENGENVHLKETLLLDILLHHHIIDKSLSMEEVQREVDVFFQGGHSTVATVIDWTLYLLGLHKDIQETVYQEIQSVFGDDKERLVTADDIKEMKYVNCVLKESLRLFPPIPFIARKTTKDIKSGSYIIPANSSAIISIFDLHRDPAVFYSPEVFDPNRFLPENCSGRNPFAFVPFSGGPRNCIGKKFAMMELNVILVNFLRNFEVHSLDHRDKLILDGSVGLRAKCGLRMSLSER